MKHYVDMIGGSFGDGSDSIQNVFEDYIEGGGYVANLQMIYRKCDQVPCTTLTREQNCKSFQFQCEGIIRMPFVHWNSKGQLTR